MSFASLTAASNSLNGCLGTLRSGYTFSIKSFLHARSMSKPFLGCDFVSSA